MDQRIIDLYDSFTHGVIDRRDFMDRLTTIAGSCRAITALRRFNVAAVPEWCRNTNAPPWYFREWIELADTYHPLF